MKKKGSRGEKNIIESLSEFDLIRNLLILIFAVLMMYLGWWGNGLALDRILFINLGYLAGVYIVLTVAYNLSKGMPLISSEDKALVVVKKKPVAK
jgi:hypothetical protein